MRRAIAIVLLAAPWAGSYAALGGAPSTFGTAPSALKARSLAATSTTAATTYSVSESTLASGTVIREYTSSSNGAVFAVSWTGKTIPDLQTLLGSHFSTMTDAAAKRPKAGRSQLAVTGSDIVIVSGGHMRAYSGRAWIPSALPAGFTAANID